VEAGSARVFHLGGNSKLGCLHPGRLGARSSPLGDGFLVSSGGRFNVPPRGESEVRAAEDVLPGLRHLHAMVNLAMPGDNLEPNTARATLS
jgi:hypothetical protein